MNSSPQSRDIESQIIEAAKKVFVRNGYDTTRMADIAKEVGISRTSLHYYYRTKEILFDAIMEQILQSVLPNIELILNREGTILEKLPSLMEEYTKVITENNFLPLFLINELNRTHNHIGAALMKNIKRVELVRSLVKTIKREMNEGLINPMPLVDVFTTFASLLVFPVLMKEFISNIFLQDSENQFQEYYKRRKDMAIKIMLDLLTPDNPENKFE